MHNNHILYGSTTGALIVNPENVQAINYTAKLRILGTNGDELHLSYSERTFDLNFECINLRNQFDIVYQYKVGDGEWSLPISQQSIRFTNLEAGTHDLHLRSISRTCGEVLDEVQLKLIIDQPWWYSWWMWMIYIGLIVLAFYGAWRIYQLHTKYMRLVVSNPSLSVDVVHDDKKKSDSIEADSEESSEFIGKVTSLVADHLSESDFNIDRLCREMAMSRTLFYIKLKSFTGKSPQDFIRIIRLERAAALLRSGRSVSETAVMAGFDNAKYFSTVFKKYFGVSPSKYV
jgi:AraC-like DNA-binding protein